MLLLLHAMRRSSSGSNDTTGSQRLAKVKASTHKRSAPPRANTPAPLTGSSPGVLRPVRDHARTDCLSDGWDSDGDSSERVVSLLISGVRARQGNDFESARDDYKRASAMQARRGKKQGGLHGWLFSLCKLRGKQTLRKAAMDIERYYRGMLGRLDARYERMAKR